MSGADYAAVFVHESRAGPVEASDTLLLPEWRLDDWRKLLAATVVQRFRTSDVVITRGAQDRALYFVAAGALEVGVTTVDGLSVSTLAHIGPGSIIGEQSFFDGQPRSANVWATTDGTLLRWEFDEFRRFGTDDPRLARDLLFAVARVLSSRLRLTTGRVRR